MKKITTIIITAFAVFVLAGCSKNGENDDFMGGDLGPVVDNYVRGYIRPVKLFLPDKISHLSRRRKHIHPARAFYSASYYAI